jgi:hypothetical protein
MSTIAWSPKNKIWIRMQGEGRHGCHCYHCIAIVGKALVAAIVAVLVAWLVAKYSKLSAPVVDVIRLTVLLVVWSLLAGIVLAS